MLGMNRILQMGAGLALVLATPFSLGQTTAASDHLRQTALALELQAKNPEAETEWLQYLKTHPASAEAYAHLGLLNARQEHYKEAVPLYRKALALNPRFPSLRLNLGLALFKGGDLSGAIAQFKPLLSSASGNSASGDSTQAQRLNILLGMAHYGLREYPAAALYLKAAAAKDPQNLELRLSLAHSCLWSKQYQCVLDTYHEILMLNAESAEADMLAGEALDELKDHRAAIQQFRAAVKANPNEPEVHFGLGYLLWTQRQYDEAVIEFQAELANAPDHAQALVYLGDAQIQLNHPELAPPLLEKAIRIDPGLELAHLDLGVLYADAGRQNDALREMKEAARVAPDDVNVHWRLGRLYRSMGKMGQAKAELDKASSITKAVDSALIERMKPGSQKPPAPNAP
jgi:tetratricopeptide (TPR) repeat protein